MCSLVQISAVQQMQIQYEQQEYESDPLPALLRPTAWTANSYCHAMDCSCSGCSDLLVRLRNAKALKEKKLALQGVAPAPERASCFPSPFA